MNRVILMGRLTRDPDVRYSQTQDGNSMAIARYTLAVDRRRSRNENEQNADFVSCVVFGKGGEFAEKYFRQGMRVLVSGRLQTGSYTNKDGQKIYTTDVVVEEQEFADSKGQQGNAPAAAPSQSQGGGQQSYSQQGFQQPYGQQGFPPQGQYQQQSMNEGFMNIPEGVEDEGLPFS